MTVASAGPVDLAAAESGAVRRRAQERLLRIDDMRAAFRLRHSGKSQREIAQTLHATQPRVHRMLKAVEARGGDEVTPGGTILRATAESTGREQLVNTLSAMNYTFTVHASYPSEGSIPGTWNRARAAYAGGLLTEEGFERVAAAIRPPQP